jgi:hypothetical protein
MELIIPAEIVAHIVSYILLKKQPKKQPIVVDDEPPLLIEYDWLDEFALPNWIENVDDANNELRHGIYNPPDINYGVQFDPETGLWTNNEKAIIRKNAQSVRDLKSLRLSCKCFASLIEPSLAYCLGVGSFMRRQYIQIMLGNFHLALPYSKKEFCRININILLNRGTSVYIGNFTWPCYFVTYAHILQDYPELVLDSEKMHLLFEEEIESTKLKYEKYFNKFAVFKRGIIPENWQRRRLVIEPPD